MNRFVLNTALLGAIAMTGVCAGKAEAQFGGFPAAPPAQAQAPALVGQGATLTLPPGVKKVVSIDAYNMLLAEVEDADGRTNIVQMKVDHNYTGGIAKLFGGAVVPTGPFVSPGYTNGVGSLNSGVNATSVGNNASNSFNGGVFNGNPFSGGFPGAGVGNFGPNTTATGTGIFAPQAQLRK